VIEIGGGHQKQTRLMDILRNPPMQPLRAIVFCGTKRMCDQLGRSMGGMGGVIHGDKEQRERDYTLSQARGFFNTSTQMTVNLPLLPLLPLLPFLPIIPSPSPFSPSYSSPSSFSSPSSSSSPPSSSSSSASV